MSMIEKNELVKRLEHISHNSYLPEQDRETIKDTISVLQSMIQKDFRKTVSSVEKLRETISGDFYIVEEVAEMFGISVQSVYKWIKLGKIHVEQFAAPGGTKYLIPKEQFKAPKYQKQIESVKRTKEALARVKPVVDEPSDLYPVTAEDDMEELDVK
ncbi:helix-turn-helix domain-containing protein [Paenibacillus cellulositrophicus]|uniref:helix-turn-helix domain-containing protein n=1 Tax=Paenibacillus cellulositrophicus TaxID=562959 RepID=UPI0012670ABA|nr:helix-turn-helix domain-containing protein [Paenibacillus cellulositrophicus]